MMLGLDDVTVGPPVDGELTVLAGGSVGKIALWSAKAASNQRPVLLIHSINAAASAYEMRPLFDHFRDRCPVYALELPSFGHSDRSNRSYIIRLMTDAIHRATDAVRRETSTAAVDVLALSLSCEFLGRAAIEKPDAFRTLGLISPTGFEKRSPVAFMRHPHPVVQKVLNAPVWSGSLFRSMMRRTVIRKFLEKTWGSRDIDQGLLDYDYRLSQQAGAQHAPYYFIAGYLFSADIFEVYRSLKCPVWVAHGTRGDFVDYQRLEQIDRPNWSVRVFDTGAFPHFERRDEVASAYEAFRSAVT